MFVPVSLSQINQMLSLQAKNNAVVHPDWLKKGWPFLRAVVVEGAEGMEHVGWKWWKAQTPDWAQAQLELVDIWHFILSDAIVAHQGDLSRAAQTLKEASEENSGEVGFDGQTYRLETLDLVRKFELTIGLAAARRFHVGLFQSMMEDADLNWTSMFKTYVGKNVLNQFRQANGYKDGSYQKVWAGEEDNVHLDRLLRQMDGADEKMPEKLWQALTDAYKSLTT